MTDTTVAEKETPAPPATAVRVPRVNEVRIAGRLGQDPEVRSVGKDQTVANLSVAINRKYKDDKGEWQEKVDFVKVAAWGKTAEFAKEQLKKGSPVLVEGRLRENTWTTKEGEKRHSLQIEATKIQSLTKTQQKSAELER